MTRSYFVAPLVWPKGILLTVLVLARVYSLAILDKEMSNIGNSRLKFQNFNDFGLEAKMWQFMSRKRKCQWLFDVIFSLA